jgi:hypothetical protein
MQLLTSRIRIENPCVVSWMGKSCELKSTVIAS